MRNKKVLIYFAAVIMILIIFIITSIFLISPVKKLSSYNESNSSSNILETLNKVEFDKKSGNLNISFTIKEDQLDNVLYKAMKNSIQVNGIESNINKDKVIIYINSHLLKVLSTQYMVQFTPELKDNNIVLNLDKAKVGRIPIPKKYIIDQLKKRSSDYLSINDDNSIKINSNALEPFKITGLDMKQEELILNLNYPIRSISDITNLFSHKIPKAVTDYIKNTLNSEAENIF